MSEPDRRPGDDGELGAVPEKLKNNPNPPPDTRIDWYGQMPRKRKNDTSSVANRTGTRALIVGIVLFVMAFILVSGAVVVLLRLPQQIVIITSTQPTVSQVIQVVTAIPSLSLPTITPVPPTATVAPCHTTTMLTPLPSPIAAQLAGNEPNMLPQFSYKDFSDISQLNFVGRLDCMSIGNAEVLRFSPYQGVDVVGAVWYKPGARVGTGFTTIFQFRVNHRQANLGGGFAFVIQNYSDSALGDGGCGVGYGGIPSSLAIEFGPEYGNADPSTNYCGYSDPHKNYIAVQSLGVKPNSASQNQGIGANLGLNSNLSVTLDDGNVHTAAILYKPGAFTVIIDNQEVIDLHNINLTTLLGLNSEGSALVGFTAVDSRDGSYVDILNWTLTSNQAPSAVSPTSVGMDLTPTLVPAVAMYSVAGGSSVTTLTPHWTGFTRTPSPASHDCASFTANPKLPKIAYETNRDGGWNIYVTDPAGALFCRLTQPGSLTAHHAYQPAWSPDGKEIVFVSDRADGFQLYLMNADGSNQRQLTDLTVNNYRPTWSPNGFRIAFVEQIDKTVFELHVMSANGGSESLLVNDSRASYPAWSPNGSKLVYDSLHNGDDVFYVADGNGGNPIKLFDNGLSTSPSHIAWSPDGGQVAFDSSRTGRPQIFIAKADGTSQRQLTNNKAWNYNACWLSDGSQIVFASTRDGHAVIYAMNDDGSAQQPITRDAAGISDDNPACSSP